MGLIELKSGVRWQTATGMSPDLAGLRPAWRPGAKRSRNILTRIADAIADLSPLVVSVAMLAVLLSTIYLFSDAAIPLNLPLASQFALSDLIVPLAFFLIQLTCRRHGPARALTQMLAGMVLSAALFIANPPILHALVPSLPALTLRAACAFGFVFVVANSAGIVIFEATRGPEWWRAPGFGGAVTALIFCALFYPLAGLNENWIGVAALHFVQLIGETALLLIPYWLLRPAIRPMPGMNGY